MNTQIKQNKAAICIQTAVRKFLEHSFQHCDGCLEYYHKSDLELFQNENLCECCIENYYTYLTECTQISMKNGWFGTPNIYNEVTG